MMKQDASASSVEVYGEHLAECAAFRCVLHIYIQTKVRQSKMMKILSAEK